MRRKPLGSGSRRTILVVDDQEDARVSTRTLLEREGHRVLAAASAEEALAMMKQREVDLLLVDYFMPGGAGEQLVRQVRAFDPFVQIILQTGCGGEKPPRDILAQLDIQGYHDKAEGSEKLLLWVDVGLQALQRLEQAWAYDQCASTPALTPSAKVVVVGSGRAADDLAKVLAAGGYEPLTAATAAEALDIFVRVRPFLLLIDDSVLDRDGADLIRRARSTEPATVVIAQTASLGAPQRRLLMRQLGLHAVHDAHDTPARILESLDSAVETTRRVARTGTAQALRGLILAKLCHDLRSYLHVIHGYTELLCGEAAAASLQPMLSRLATASDNARDLVQQYLDLAHLDSNRVVVRRELVDIDSLIEDLKAHVTRQIGQKRVEFRTLVPAGGVVIHSDGEKLRAILKQLLTNAVTFSVGGTIELGVCFAADHTSFVLTDTGPGMCGLELAGLCATQAADSGGPRAATPGLGLALAIALRLSELLGGTLTADRSGNGGAVFMLSLPAVALAGAAQFPTVH
jgi:signal transduction histidine kinase